MEHVLDQLPRVVGIILAIMLLAEIAARLLEALGKIAVVVASWTATKRDDEFVARWVPRLHRLAVVLHAVGGIVRHISLIGRRP